MKDLRFQIIGLSESFRRILFRSVNRRDGMGALLERAWANICIEPFSAFSAQFRYLVAQTKIRFRQCGYGGSIPRLSTN